MKALARAMTPLLVMASLALGIPAAFADDVSGATADTSGSSDPGMVERNADVARVMAQVTAGAQVRPESGPLLRPGIVEPDGRPPLPDCGASDSSCVHPVAHDYQDRSKWCVPAASKAMVYGVASQSYLAEIEHTSNTSGTNIRNAASALNIFVTHSYGYSSGTSSYTSGGDLLAKVRYTVGRKGAYNMLGVQGKYLGYWPTSWSGLHVVVAQGWSRSNLSVWDPINQSWNTRRGGVHGVSTSTAYNAGRGNGRAMVW